MHGWPKWLFPSQATFALKQSEIFSLIPSGNQFIKSWISASSSVWMLISWFVGNNHKNTKLQMIMNIMWMFLLSAPWIGHHYHSPQFSFLRCDFEIRSSSSPFTTTIICRTRFWDGIRWLENIPAQTMVTCWQLPPQPKIVIIWSSYNHHLIILSSKMVSSFHNTIKHSCTDNSHLLTATSTT